MSYFDEKARQTSVDSMMSFGIPISSKYASATELSEMLLFTHQVARLGLNECIKQVHYDSKACICFIELHDEGMWYDDEGRQIKSCAENTIQQFQWDGMIGHSHELTALMESGEL
ncbi:hypothetical protein ACK38W_10040 [Aeromonas veronii]